MPSRRNAVVATAVAAVLAAGPAVAPAAALEPLTIGTSALKGATLRLYGFVEADSIYDTTQSFTEEPDSNLVQKRSSILGQRSREQMSVRNSRLGLELNVPDTDSGLKTKAVFEADFLGNNAENATPGTTPNPQTERDFLNNAAMRVRHAFIDLTKGELNAKIGQYWSLFGWQPYYFPGETTILPSSGMLYRRFVQARVTDTRAIADGWT
ncbi:MAG: hypothetical protein KGL74_14350, partial [Elusimicrobia bacterium]|nr:hypothetical protein [Elusimicrobiota bacterium]